MRSWVFTHGFIVTVLEPFRSDLFRNRDPIVVGPYRSYTICLVTDYILPHESYRSYIPRSFALPSFTVEKWKSLSRPLKWERYHPTNPPGVLKFKTTHLQEKEYPHFYGEDPARTCVTIFNLRYWRWTGEPRGVHVLGSSCISPIRTTI